MTDDITTRGFAIVRGLAGAEECRAFVDRLGPVEGAGRRGLLGMPEVLAWARSERVLRLIRPHLPSEPIAVRAIYFDKSPDLNWLVPWHQDLTVALRARAEGTAFGPWSIKEGIPHAQPPAEFLERMLTIRLHLDAADEANGALRVLPGSHRDGRVSGERIRELRASTPEVLCAASVGYALLMRPLLLHASGKAIAPRHRRVLHVEFAGFDLPPSLQWHEAA